MADQKPTKLTDAQYDSLMALPRSFWPSYKPIVKLVQLGFATRVEGYSKGLGGNPKYEITELGKAQLKVEQERRTK